jgi:hypothetical protein
MHQARLSADRICADLVLSQSWASRTVLECGSSCRARRAIAVASTCGRKALPKTTLLPAFHPPARHARSRSISTPRDIRLSNASPRLHAVNCFSATRLNVLVAPSEGATLAAPEGPRRHWLMAASGSDSRFVQPGATNAADVLPRHLRDPQATGRETRRGGLTNQPHPQGGRKIQKGEQRPAGLR